MIRSSPHSAETAHGGGARRRGQACWSDAASTPLASIPVRRGGKPAAADTAGVTGSGWGGLYRRGPDLGRAGAIRPARPVPGLPARLQVGGRRGPLRLVGGRQMEPDRGAGRIPEVAPPGGEVLDQEAPVSLGRRTDAFNPRRNAFSWLPPICPDLHLYGRSRGASTKLMMECQPAWRKCVKEISLLKSRMGFHPRR